MRSAHLATKQYKPRTRSIRTAGRVRRVTAAPPPVGPPQRCRTEPKMEDSEATTEESRDQSTAHDASLRVATTADRRSAPHTDDQRPYPTPTLHWQPLPSR